jgi:hypothetical protein
VHFEGSTIKHFMKKLLVCVGLAAIGTSSLRAQFNPGLTADEMQKAWSVAATLRGFYDDNYLTVPNGEGKRHSYGVEVAPQASFNHSVDQTTFNANAVYDLKYFTDRKITEEAVTFNANMNHTFTEAYAMNASETFIYSQEPQVDGLVSTPLRTSQNNIYNDATLGGTAELSKTLSLKASYQNNLYAYEQLQGDVPGPARTTPSFSALLDRIDQLGSLEADWKATDDLDALLGYQYENVDYTSPEAIIYGATPAADINSKSRNNDSHFVFVGADYQFNSQLTASLRAGGQYIEYDNAPTHVNDTSPYVDASLNWQYMKDSSLLVGVKHQHNATDVIGSVNAQGNPVLDTEATAAYVNLTQTIAGALTAGVLGQWQHSEFNGGNVDGESENFYIFGLNLAYRFNPYFSAETGYNWNKLISDVNGRDYTRNEVYIGVKGEY